MKFAARFGKLREEAIRAAPSSKAREKEERDETLRELLRWLIFVPLILLLIFGCGSLALIQTRPAQADTRSYMAADYQPWEITVFKPLDPRVVLEILRDQELFPETFGEPIQPKIIPGSFWDPTETPVPGAPTPSPTALTPLPTSTYTLTPTLFASATSTLTVTASHTPSSTPTSTPFGPPSPIPPGVPPANNYWFYDDTSPLSHMMYTTLANGNNRSGESASFHSPSFVAGQVLPAGTTTVNFYAWNPAPAAAAFTAELRGGGVLLGAGTFALPPNLFNAYFFSASFSTSSHNFADGERLEVSFSFAAPAEMYWDGAFNYSGVNVPLVATTPTPTASSTVTVSPTPSGTAAPSSTPTNTLTNTPVPPSLTPTNTPVPPSLTPTNTPVPPSSTPTITPTPGPVVVTVNRETCNIEDGLSSVACSISPALTDTSKTFVIFQATSSNNTPNSSNVRCYIASTTTITCERNGTTGPVNIAWQTAEFSSGVTVQHLQPGCSGLTINVPITAVDMSKTFLLHSQERDGINQSQDDFRSVELTSSTNVQIRFGGGTCGAIQQALQVVEFTGASVTRGVLSTFTGLSQSVTGLASINSSKSILLYSWIVSSDTTIPEMCERMVRGEIASATSLSFSRGDRSAVCGDVTIDEISWERIEFTGAGTSVQQVQPSMAAGTGTTNATITSIDTGRTIVFAGGQSVNGQSIGEGSYAGDDVIGAMIGRHTLTSSTNLQVVRDDTNGTATWTSYVVEFGP